MLGMELDISDTLVDRLEYFLRLFRYCFFRWNSQNETTLATTSALTDTPFLLYELCPWYNYKYTSKTLPESISTQWPTNALLETRAKGYETGTSFKSEHYNCSKFLHSFFCLRTLYSACISGYWNNHLTLILNMQLSITRKISARIFFLWAWLKAH